MRSVFGAPRNQRTLSKCTGVTGACVHQALLLPTAKSEDLGIVRIVAWWDCAVQSAGEAR